jgi:hypothetical protein
MEWDLKEPENLTHARLIAAAPEFVFEQLKFYGESVNRWEGKKDLEKLLLKRGDKLVNLALAQFATDMSVVSDLYEQATRTPECPDDECYQSGLRVACLSNRHFFESLSFPSFDLNALMAKGLTPESTALLTNPSVPSSILQSLYTKTNCFAHVDETNWLHMVAASSRNERLNTDDSDDTGPDLGLLRIHRTIFGFLETAPVSVLSAHTVIRLLGALDPQHTCWPEAIEHVLQRWSVVELKDYKEQPRQGYFTHLTLAEEMRCLIAALYGRKNTSVKDGPKHFGSPNDKDIAMRCAFYGGEDLSLNQLKAGFERDKDVFVFAALKNRLLLLNKEKRAFIESQIFDPSLWREYRRRCEQIHKRNKYFDERPVSDQPDEARSSRPPVKYLGYVWSVVWSVLWSAAYVLIAWYVLGQLHTRPEALIVPILGILYCAQSFFAGGTGSMLLTMNCKLSHVIRQLKQLHAGSSWATDDIAAMEDGMFNASIQFFIGLFGSAAISLQCAWKIYTVLSPQLPF